MLQLCNKNFIPTEVTFYHKKLMEEIFLILYIVRMRIDFCAKICYLGHWEHFSMQMSHPNVHLEHLFVLNTLRPYF